MNEAELIKIQEWRCSVKKFDASKKIPAAAWAALEKSLLLSPSSYGLQPWKFLVITNADVRKKLLPLSWGQSQVTDASHFVVFAYLNKMNEAYVQKFIEDTAEIRGLPPASLDGYKNMMIGNVVKGMEATKFQEWAKKQVYIALGNFMTSAAAIGIDTCPMEGLDPEKYDETLGLKGTEYSTVVACAAGYRHSEDGYSKMKKVRFPASVVIKNI